MKYYVGIDLGGTNSKAGIVDENGRILYKNRIKTRPEEDQVTIIRDLVGLTQQVIAESGFAAEQIAAIGIGSPGTPDNDRGILVYTNNLPFHLAPMRAVFRETLDYPVYIDNDANVAALAESVAGAARQARHSVTLTLGTGIGCGVVINNRIYSGFNHAASEFGHSTFVHGGEPCNCGRIGCVEQYASATALSRQTERAAAAFPDSLLGKLIAKNGGRADGQTAFIGKRAGDAAADQVVEGYLEILADMLANVINIFQPEVIAIGGGVCAEGDDLLLPVRERAIARSYLGEGVAIPRIVLAEMGNDAGIIGAAMMAENCVVDGIPG